MKSISGKKWSEYKIHQRLIDKTSQDYGFSPILSKIMIERNFSKNEILSINNKELFNSNFRHILDFQKTSSIIENSLIDNERILVFGDYDVDGSCSTALLINFFKSINQTCDFYIPNRINDGYGPNINLLKRIIKNNYKLIIFVDCGSNSIEEIDFLNQKKIKTIIIDHHQIQGKIPNSSSMINPLKNNGYNNLDYLCSTSLTFFLVKNILLRKKIKSSFNINDYLFFVSLATVADVMPMRKINRSLCHIGLDTFSRKKIKYFNSILDFYKINRKLDIEDLSFLLCPILNSGGRLNDSKLSTTLLTTQNERLIETISNKLIKLNERRKKIEKIFINDIVNKFKDIKGEVIFIFNPSINEGIIGILAAKLTEKFNKPSFVITQSNNYLKGSCRSILNFDLGTILYKARLNKLVLKGGGHKMAGGFMLKKENLNKLKFFLNKQFKKKNIINELKYTSEQSLNSVNKFMCNEISKLKPFGNDNQSPIFLFKKLKVIKSKIINERHIMVVFSDSGKKTIEAISFNSLNTTMGHCLIFFKKKINVIANLKENFFNNKKKMQLVVHDIII